MTTILAIAIGLLYAGGTYMILRRSLFRLILGLVILSHATTLLIFTAGGLTRAQPPIIAPGETQLPAVAADPLPQALILTAIVINFGVLAFAVTLFRCGFLTLESDDVDSL